MSAAYRPCPKPGRTGGYQALSNGSLEPLLLDVQVSEGYPLWAALPPGRQRSPKVLEFLTERLGLAPQTTGKIDGRQPGASNPPRRSRHRESPMRILLILGGLRNGYGIDPDKTISPRSISFFIGGKLANACLCAKSKLERLCRTLGEISQGGVFVEDHCLW